MDSTPGVEAQKFADLLHSIRSRQRHILRRGIAELRQELQELDGSLAATLAELREEPQALVVRDDLKARARREAQCLQACEHVAAVNLEQKDKISVRTHRRGKVPALSIEFDLAEDGYTVCRSPGESSTDPLTGEKGFLSDDLVVQSAARILISHGYLDLVVALAVAHASRYSANEDARPDSLRSAYLRWRVHELLYRKDLPKTQKTLEGRLSQILRGHESVCRQLARLHAAWIRLNEECAAANRSNDLQAYDVLRRHPWVRRVTLEGPVVQIFTGDIVLQDQGKRRIGPFRIDIDPLNSSVRMLNLDRAQVELSEGIHHPHVQQQGRPCWGNIGAWVADAFVRGDVAGIALRSLDLLLSYNRDSCFRKAERWPNLGQLERSLG